MPIAREVGLWAEGARLPLAPYHGDDFTHRLPYLYHALGDEKAARDAAFLLARWAYAYPAHTDAEMLGYAVVAPASTHAVPPTATLPLGASVIFHALIALAPDAPA